MAKHCSYMQTPEYREKHSQAMLESYAKNPMSQETKDKISLSNSGKIRSEEHSKNISLAKKGKPSPLKGILGKGKGVLRSPETRKRMSEGRKRYFIEHPEAKKILSGRKGIHYTAKPSLTRSASLKGKQNALGTHHHSPTRSNTHRELWRNPKHVRKMLKAFNASPNKAETTLGKLIDLVSPNQFAYNGDFSQGITLGGRIPDFVNINGKKQVIEYFGSYWHDTHDAEAEKIQTYAKVGWHCLVIWDYEMQNKPAVIDKLRRFGGDC